MAAVCTSDGTVKLARIAAGTPVGLPVLRPDYRYSGWTNIARRFMPLALIALGSNLGERAKNLDLALKVLQLAPGVQVRAVSSWHATQPVGGPPGQGEFLNGAALLETTLAPRDLLARLLDIETALGRVRHERWSPRSIDLDLLLYDDLVVNSAELTVPHPRMTERGFVLEPAAEIAGAMRHPTANKTIAELAEMLRAKK